MCRNKFRIMRWLLGLMVLAVIVGTSPLAYGDAGIGFTMNLNNLNNLQAGTSYTGSFTMTSTAIPSNLSETLQDAFLVMFPGCKNQLAGVPCGSADPGVITVNSATTTAGCFDAGGVNQATWVVSAGATLGSFNLTPSLTIVFPAAGSVCTVGFAFTVNKIATADSRSSTPSVLDTDSSVGPATVLGTDGTSGSATGTTHNAFTIPCSVQIDKQVSCSSDQNGPIWTDVGYGDNATTGCVGTPGQPVQYRYHFKNTGTVGVASCTISDNVLGSITPVETSLAAGAEGSFASFVPPAQTPELCETHPGDNKGTVSCTCSIPVTAPPTVTNDDTATHQCCGVAVDKQVSCNGQPFVDIGGFQTADQDGTANDSCSAINGQAVAIRYFAKNTGTVSLSCSTGSDPAQGLVDRQVTPGTTIFSASQTLAVSQTVGPITQASDPNTADILLCSTALDTAETTGNKAEIDCTCNAAANVGGPVTVSAYDIAKISCGTPSFDVSKTCIQDPNAAKGNFNVDVSIKNNSASIPLSCSVVDSYFTGACTTPPIGGNAAGSVSLSLTNPTPVAASTTVHDTGTFSSATTVCNQATVNCSAGGVAQPVQYATALCPVQGNGCFTRTPGYWGTHPAQTQTVLGAGGLTVCGINLTNTTAGLPGSAIEDVCGTGGPDFKPNNTSPQQLQLIRQCTSAALNLRVSGDARSQLDCEAADTGITAAFNNCCMGPTSICDSGAKASVINTSACITTLDAFNNKFDPTDFPSWLVNSKAQPGQCQIANGNGFVNPGRNLGSK